jgi:hypothetical protein
MLTFNYKVVPRHPVLVVDVGDLAPVNIAKQEIALPFEVFSEDDEAFTLYYRFEDSASWDILPRSVNEKANVVPFSIFAPLSYNGDHSMQIYVSDGFESSEPITFGIQDIFEKIRNTVKGHFESGISPNTIIESGLKKVGSILPNAAKVSYSFDDNNIWSDELSYPITRQSIAIPVNSGAYVTSGDHKITYEFVDNLNNVAKAEYYYVVSAETADETPNDVDDVAEDDTAPPKNCDRNGYVFGSLSTAGFVGVVIGGVTLIILGVGVILLLRRRKRESSSTGLIEEDE